MKAGIIESKKNKVSAKPMGAVWSLRKLKDEVTSPLRIIRSTDAQEADLYFDANNTVSLNSLTSLGVTLADFISPANAIAEIKIWYDGSGNGFDLGNLTTARPKLTNAAKEVILENGKPTVDFSTGSPILFVAGFTPFTPGNNFSVYTVSSHNNSNNIGSILCTQNFTDSISYRFVMFRDRRTGSIKRNGLIENNTGTYAADLSQARNVRQLLQSIQVKDSTISGWDNGIAGSQNVPFAGFYENEYLRVGSQHSGLTPLNGNIQEINVEPANTPEERIAMENSINAYYNIYI